MATSTIKKSRIGRLLSSEIHRITEANQTYTVTENCWMSARISAEDETKRAVVYINGCTAVLADVSDMATTIPVFKGDTIKTREYGNYYISFFAMGGVNARLLRDMLSGGLHDKYDKKTYQKLESIRSIRVKEGCYRDNNKHSNLGEGNSDILWKSQFNYSSIRRWFGSIDTNEKLRKPPLRTALCICRRWDYGRISLFIHISQLCVIRKGETSQCTIIHFPEMTIISQEEVIA